MMIKRLHPSFNLGKEFLSMLSMTPARRSDILHDLGIHTKRLGEMISGYSHLGVRTGRKTGFAGNCVWVEHKHWPEIESITRAYMDEVYGK